MMTKPKDLMSDSEERRICAIGEIVNDMDWYIHNLSIAFGVEHEKAVKIFRRGFEEAVNYLRKE